MESMIFPITALIAAWGLGALLVKMLIPFLEKKQFRQFVRDEGPKSHLHKTGTPSMGGIGIIGTAVICTAAISALTGRLTVRLIAVMGAMILFGVIGFIDDYEKAVKKNNLGISPKQKIVLQVAFSLAFGIFAALFSGNGFTEATSVFIPVIDVSLDLGYFYIPFVMFVMVAFSNAVNLTDGLDGLASGITALVSFFMVVAAIYFGYGDQSVLFGAVAGGCLGFLVFNRYPARIFMGDTGSMALGGVLSAGAVIMKMEFLLAIAGLIYVIEALSVVIQVTYYKKTKKRIFKMAPIHHHFELCGMKETKVVMMFWGVTVLFCVLAIVLMHI